MVRSAVPPPPPDTRHQQPHEYLVPQLSRVSQVSRILFSGMTVTITARLVCLGWWMMEHTGSSLRLLSIASSHCDKMYIVSSKIVVLLSSWVTRFYPMPMTYLFHNGHSCFCLPSLASFFSQPDPHLTNYFLHYRRLRDSGSG